MADDEPFDPENFDLDAAMDRIKEQGDSGIMSLLRSAIPPTSAMWQPRTPEQIRDDIRKAMERIREEVYYTPTCGSPGHPHVVHPNYWHRIMPWAEYVRLSDEDLDSMRFTACGNCGSALPVYPGEGAKFDSDPL